MSPNAKKSTVIPLRWAFYFEISRVRLPTHVFPVNNDRRSNIWHSDLTNTHIVFIYTHTHIRDPSGVQFANRFLSEFCEQTLAAFFMCRMCKASLIFAFISHIRNVINLTTLLISFEAYPLTYWQFRLPDDVMCLLIWRLLFWFAGKLPKIKTMFPFFTKLVTLFCEAKFQVFWS